MNIKDEMNSLNLCDKADLYSEITKPKIVNIIFNFLKPRLSCFH